MGKMNTAIAILPDQMRMPFRNCELRCTELIPLYGSALAQTAQLNFLQAVQIDVRDQAKTMRASELQYGNMNRLNQLFSTARGEELLKELRPTFYKLFEADNSPGQRRGRL